jgi:hypothetical protein
VYKIHLTLALLSLIAAFPMLFYVGFKLAIAMQSIFYVPFPAVVTVLFAFWNLHRAEELA